MLDELAAVQRDAPVPGSAIAVFTRGDVLVELVHGVADLDTGRAVDRGDWWDLASLTKTVVTVPEVLDLVAGGRIALDEPLGSAWPPAERAPVAAATVAQLLSYNAGLPATVPFYERLRGRDAIVRAALETPLERPPGSGAVYSDVSFILLGAMVEALTGRSLAALARQRTGLRYAPLPGPAVAPERCAWRGRLDVGEVHDENAAAMGGISGHAGAFGTIGLMTRVARGWLVQPQRCWSTNGDGERFGLGWWLAPTRGIGGTRPGASGFGMAGFVGNRIWLEPQRGYGVVLLSNRVHPVRTDRAPFQAWTARILDTVAAAVDMPCHHLR
jgi:CubicO group peptidase (beta-lactamase class C family)